MKKWNCVKIFSVVLCTAMIAISTSCSKAPTDSSSTLSGSNGSSALTGSDTVSGTLDDNSDLDSAESGGATSSGSTNTNTNTSSKNSTNTSKPTGTGALDTTQPDKGTKLPTADLKGYEFTIAFAISYGGTEYTFADSASGDAERELINKIEKLYNCKIKFKLYDATASYRTIYPKVMAGDTVADILIIPNFMVGTYMAGGILADLNTIPNLNLNGNYWYSAARDAFTVNGKTYAIAGDYNLYAHKLEGIYYNKNLIKELKLTDPYDLVKQGKWNFDTFLEMAKKATKDLNGDGKMNLSDQYGVAAYPHEVFFASNGCRKITTDKNGKAVFGMNNNTAISTLQWLHDMYYKENVCMKLASNLWQTHDSSEWIKYFQQFADGKALFLPTCVNDAQYIRDMEDDYGWVPAPMGPNTNTYASFVEVNAGTMAVLNTNGKKELERIGPVLEAIGQLGYTMAEAYENTEVKQILFRGDSKSMEMLKICKENAVIDLGEANVVNGMIEWYREFMNTENASIASLINSKADAYQSEIDKIYNK